MYSSLTRGLETIDIKCIVPARPTPKRASLNIESLLDSTLRARSSKYLREKNVFIGFGIIGFVEINIIYFTDSDSLHSRFCVYVNVLGSRTVLRKDLGLDKLNIVFFFFT